MYILECYAMFSIGILGFLVWSNYKIYLVALLFSDKR